MDEKPKIYMVMVIVTFLLYAVATTFAWMEYDRYTNEPLSEYDVKLFND